MGPGVYWAEVAMAGLAYLARQGQEITINFTSLSDKSLDFLARNKVEIRCILALMVNRTVKQIGEPIVEVEGES